MRSQHNRMIGGVCAGLAEYFAMDPTLMRVIFVAAFFLLGAGPLLYLILWLIIPSG